MFSHLFSSTTSILKKDFTLIFVDAKKKMHKNCHLIRKYLSLRAEIIFLISATNE